MNSKVNPLEAAYLRVARGREHLAELARVCDDVCDEYADRLESFYPRVLPNPDALLTVFDSRHPEPSIPPRAAILVGEIAYNFRAALDYVVGAVSSRHTPIWAGKRRNQFPIESTHAGFASRRNTFLAGVSDAGVSTIELYQPYTGCLWTRDLADLSNRDKHNDLVVIAQGFEITLQESDGAELHRATITLHLRLGHDDQDRRVLPTLENIGIEVSKVLDTFR